MEAEKNPFDAIRAMMLENLERVGIATQTYIDMVERTLRLFPGANQEQIRTFREYIERQVATNRDFGEKLLRAKDFQEAFRIQVEYFQAQLKGAAWMQVRLAQRWLARSKRPFLPNRTSCRASLPAMANPSMRFHGGPLPHLACRK